MADDIFTSPFANMDSIYGQQPMMPPQAPMAFGGAAPAAARPAAPAAAPAPKAPAAPTAPAAAAAPVAPGDMTDEQMRQEMKQEAYADWKQRPKREEIIAAYDKYGSEVSAAQDEYQSVIREQTKALQEAMPLRQAAPQYQDIAKQVSPLAMVLMAFGGKAFGLTGQMMMGAATGMVEGTAEGNKERYQQAYKQWQDAYQQQKDHYNEIKDVMAQLEKQAQGNMLKRQQAAQTALEIIGARQDMAKQGLNAVTGLDRTQAQLDKQHQDYELKHAQLEIAWAKEDRARDKQHTKETADLSKAENVADEYVSTVEDLKDAWSNLKSYVEGPKGKKLRSGLDLATVSTSTLLTRIQQSGDTEAARLLSDYKAKESVFKGPGFRAQIEGIPASALRVAGVDKAELSALPDLQNTGWNQTNSAIELALKKGTRMRERVSRQLSRGNQSSAFQGTGTAEDPIKLD